MNKPERDIGTAEGKVTNTHRHTHRHKDKHIDIKQTIVIRRTNRHKRIQPYKQTIRPTERLTGKHKLLGIDS